jgi:small subunit ribosomal protein S6
MRNQPPTYDLTLLLSTGAAEDQRAKILAEVESEITGGGGSIERNDDWGARALSYRINHQADAEYHLLQFTGPPPLLESLSQRLRITDGVLRFRIIKTPASRTVPDAKSASAGATQRSNGGGGGSRQRADAGDDEGAGAETTAPASES